MAGPNGNTRDRLDLLEREIQQIRRQLNQQPCREASAGAPRQLRLAKTVSISGSYPTPPADTYGIIFLDTTFTESAGNNGHTNTSRQSTSGAFAHSMNARYYPVNSLVIVERQNHKWVIIEDSGQSVARFIEFTLPSALTTSDASKASCTVVAYWGGYDPGSTVTVYNYADVAGGYQWAGANGAHGYAVWDDVLSRYRIIDLNCP